jgi:hypothetical protein
MIDPPKTVDTSDVGKKPESIASNTCRIYIYIYAYFSLKGYLTKQFA